MNYILIILCLFLIISELSGKLIFVMTHFRHGARSPNIKGSIDEVGEKWDSSGQLTGVGERMHYLLGLRNRIKYVTEKNFLSEKYNPSELSIICSTVGRTFVSLSSHLQGLYPESENKGEYLTEAQLKTSNPPCDVSNTRIIEEKNELKNNALPNSMTIIPFEVVNILNKSSCRGRPKNLESSSNLPNVLSLENEFNKKYKEKVNQLKIKNNSGNYSFSNITKFCDSMVASYVDGRSLTKLSNLGINIKELYDYCLKALNISFGEYTIVDNLTIYSRGSYFMELLVNNTKSKIDEDIGKNNSSNAKSPKMLIISGHDNTVSRQQLFLIFALGKSMAFFRNPTFASQMAFEIWKYDDNKKNGDYSDYFINYYFNDELLLNMSVDKFLGFIEQKLLSEDQINNICNEDTSNNDQNNTNNSNNTEKNTTNNEIIKLKVVEKNKYYSAPLIIFTSLFGISLIANIITIYLLVKKVSSVKRHFQNSESNVQIPNN